MPTRLQAVRWGKPNHPTPTTHRYRRTFEQQRRRSRCTFPLYFVGFFFRFIFRNIMGEKRRLGIFIVQWKILCEFFGAFHFSSRQVML